MTHPLTIAAQRRAAASTHHAHAGPLVLPQARAEYLRRLDAGRHNNSADDPAQMKEIDDE